MNHELSDVQAGFRKGRGNRDQIATSDVSLKKQEGSRQHLLLLYWLCQTLWLCGSPQTGKFWKRWEYQTTWPASWEICMQVRKQQLEMDMEQQTVSKSGKEYVKALYCHPVYLAYMQSILWEMLDWMKHKLESRLLGEGETVLSNVTQLTSPKFSIWILAVWLLITAKHLSNIDLVLRTQTGRTKSLNSQTSFTV